ncbi:MAG TPA: OadG family protein [Anaerolineales bacterium]|nr:OadG family protein [Anaerolineales bacterium]
MSNLTLALQITALGMGLVFAVIILIWWMMALLTSLTADKKSPPKALTSASPVEDEKARAAAIAVAIAMAEHQLSQTHPLPLPPTAIVSAWQLGMRTRQLAAKGSPIVRNPRRIG